MFVLFCTFKAAVAVATSAGVLAFLIIALSSVFLIADFKSLDSSKLDSPALTAESKASYNVSVVGLNSAIFAS